MATAKLTTFITFLAFSSLLINSSFQARILPFDNNADHYTTFDVSASIQQALHALSSTKTTLQQSDVTTKVIKPKEHDQFKNSSAFSVPLYSREVIKLEEHESYESLVLSRLERDVTRVNSLYSKLGFQIETRDISTPVSEGSGEYFATVGFGTPSKTEHLAIDTGSDVTWIQCKPCTTCYRQTDQIYDPSASSTYKPLACSAPECLALDKPACSAGVCHYQVDYGDGSFTTGDLITDTVSLGSNGRIPKLAIGCGHDNEGLFGTAGLLGLGRGALSFTSQIKATSFSYCLPDRNSKTSSTLDFNSARHSDSISTQLIKNNKINTFFYIKLTGLTVGGKSVNIPPSLFALDSSTGRGGIIVDSGTSITRLTSKAYTALRDAFRSLTTNFPSASAIALFDTCYDLSSMTSVEVPTVGFVFGNGGKTLSLPVKNYFIPVNSRGKFCFAFTGTKSALSIIGDVQQQGIRVSYDLVNSVVGFSPDKC